MLGAGPPSQQLLGVRETAGSTPSPGVATAAQRPDPGGPGAVDTSMFVPAVDTLTGYRWPIRNATLTQRFGSSPWGNMIVEGQTFHDGIDLATHCGDSITAAHAGTVLAAGRHYDAFIGWVGDLTAYLSRLDAKHLWLTLPNVVVIDDGNGYRSIYAHFRDVAVAPGDVVGAGSLLGHEGATGRASGCHLHYGLFSPKVRETFTYDPVGAAHMLLPSEELARVDPLLVLPPLNAAGIH